MKPFMRHPNSWHMVFWEIASLLLIMYDFVIIPLTVFSLPDVFVLRAMDWLIRLFWTLDLIMSFFTGYIDREGLLITKPSLVAARYGKEQFPIDLSLVGLKQRFGRLAFAFSAFGGEKSRILLEIS